MAITPNDLDTDDDSLARRVLHQARLIAPCLDSLDGENRETAIAVIDGLIAELPEPGSARVKSLSRNGTSMTFDLSSAFTLDVRTSLGAFCVPETLPGLPRGSFPPALSSLTNNWLEGEYT